MYGKIAIAGATAAVIIGSGTAALAVSGTTSAGPPASATPSAPSPSGAAHGRKGHGRQVLKALRRTVHGQVVTRNKDGQFVTHQVTRGTVTSVSPSEVTVRAADGTSERYTVGASTKVRVRTAGKGAAGKITDVHAGDTVLAAGTGKGTPVATHVVDLEH